MGLSDFGRIGMGDGQNCKAMGMKVIACDEYPSPEGKSWEPMSAITELLAQSDVIALHCPLTPGEYGACLQGND